MYINIICYFNTWVDVQKLYFDMKINFKNQISFAFNPYQITFFSSESSAFFPSFCLYLFSYSDFNCSKDVK